MLRFKNKIISFNTIAILIFTGIICLIYSGALSFDFINFDDPVYVTDNPAVKSGINFESISWAFGIHSDICMYWQPVAWLSHMLDCELHDIDAGKHHLTSIILHLLNTIILFILLRKMTGAKLRSAFAAAIFAAHPINVDPVIWISERKTLLSGFFWLSGFLAYYYYTKKSNILRYLSVLIFFTLGILSKPVMATFPCALLLFDYWPLKRIDFKNNQETYLTVGKLLIEKIPFFAIFGLWFITPFLSTTLMANETLPETISYSLRTSNAIVSYSKYIFKFIAPFNLSIHYPYPTYIPLIKMLSSLFFLTTITIYFLKQYKDKPFLIIGWLWFGGVLFPSSGILLGTLWPEMADRWAYLPFIGLCIIISWGLMSSTFVKNNFPKVVIPLFITIIFYFSITAKFQTMHWKNSITIFKHAESIIGYDPLFHQNIAAELSNRGKFSEAIQHQKIILGNDPDNIDANFNTGLLYSKLKEYNDALNYLTKVIKTEPDNANAYLAMADVYVNCNKPLKAIEVYKTACIKTNKIPLKLYYNISVVLKNLKKYDEAELYLIKLLGLKKSHVNGNLLYGDILVEMKKFREAQSFYKYAAKNDNSSAAAFNGLGITYAYGGEFDKAISAFQKAVSLDPLMEKARLNLQNTIIEKYKSK